MDTLLSLEKPMINPTKMALLRHGWVNHYRLPAGEANPVIHLFLCDENRTPPRPKTGISLSSGYQAHYLAPEAQKPLPLELVPGPDDDDRCGFWEIDRQLMPGLYGFQVPSYLRTFGHTYIYFCFPGARPQYLELQGLGYDPYDAFALGLTTWVRSSCHEHLTSGLRKSMPSVLRPLLVDWLKPVIEE